ncbi:hypothetical protein [Staphylococcus xylosus]
MEAITIKRKDNNCELFSDLHSMKLGERDINTVERIIPNIHDLEDNKTGHYNIKNETLREIGLNNHGLSKPIGLRNKRKKR